MLALVVSCSVQEDIDEDTQFVEDIEDDDDKLFGFLANDLFDMIMHCLYDEFDLKLQDDEGNWIIELTAENPSSSLF